jgi:predicted DNA-binding mobile mystery protein A
MKDFARNILITGLDERLLTLQTAKAVAGTPIHGWLRAVRTAIGIKQRDIAARLGVTRQSYAQFENAEKQGSISLNSLQRAAGAMDCELIYFVVPRAAVARTYAELAQHHDPEFKHLQASEHSMALEGQAVGDLPGKKRP